MSKQRIGLLIGVFLSILTLVAVTPGTFAQSSNLFINEILVGNASTTLDTDYYNYSSWIEIYNAGTSAVDLKNYSLSYLEYNATTPVVWKIPVTVSVPAKGYVLLWADEHNATRHASFELDMRGQTIQLLNPSNGVLDSVTYDMRSGSTLLPDISYGRQTNGGGTWVYFDQPTAAASNTTMGSAVPTPATTPVFSPPGGFYAGNQSISLSTSEAGAEIRYTTDGSIPTPSSALYSGPISVTGPTVVRARTFVADKLDSLTASHTYLINVNTDLPVVSLATKPAHLFDDTIGIYVVGTNGKVGNCSTTPANWNQKWERPASIEMFETNGNRVVAQDVGIEIHGNCARQYARKSLEIKSKRIYGDNDIDYQVLPDKPIDEYKRLVLRNSGQDWNNTLFRDAMQQYLVKDTMDIDYQAYRPAVVFLNGQYWGIHNIRDKADEAFPEQNYGLDADTDFDMIEKKGFIETGNTVAWDALYSFVSANNLAIQANYDYVKSQVDLEEYMNYFILEIHINNTDWPDNNIRYWRAYDNGHWRWVVYDLDLGYYNPATNYLSYIMTGGTSAEKYQTLLFRKLMENVSFRNEFAQRFASHLNISFAPVRVNALIDWFRAGIASEMPAHIARWGVPASITSWDSDISQLRNFSNNRPVNMRNHLNTYLGSPGTANLTVNITGNGDVLAADVKVPGSGYTGPYFKTIPMTLEAVPTPGWKFVKWQETGDTNPFITVTLTGNMTRTAVFEAAALPNLVVNEIHYNPADAQGSDTEYEFVELYNVGATAVNLAGFSLADGIGYTFPAGASIASGEHIVVAKTAATYAGKGYQVFEWSTGDLSNGGETLNLTDSSGSLVDTVSYDDDGTLGWPTAPDGGGPSLSLLSPALDNNSAGSWAASVSSGGSPGAANAFTPPQPATLTIVKQVAGDVPAVDWQFTGALGAFALPAAGGQQTFGNLAPGSYPITETAVSGYTAAVTCSNGASGGASVTVTLAGGDNVTCTFVNTQSSIPPIGHCDPPVAGNLILNPGFENQKVNWIFYTTGKGTYSIATTNPYECAGNAQIAITTSGSNVQLYQKNFTLLPNTTYTLRMAARSSNGQNAQLFVQRFTSPYTSYGLNGYVMDLTSEWQVFEVEFTTKGFSSATSDTRLKIWLAPFDTNGTIFEFDDVVLVKK